MLEEIDGSLRIAGKTEDFGDVEDIRAVRFAPNEAFLVTFKKTDPLFKISLKVPRAPVISGKLEVPAFSTYLKTLPGQRVLGVGFDALDEGSFAWFQGIQISLFDVKDPLKMNRLDNRVMGTRGSFSLATSDPHALYFDGEVVRT